MKRNWIIAGAVAAMMAAASAGAGAQTTPDTTTPGATAPTTTAPMAAPTPSDSAMPGMSTSGSMGSMSSGGMSPGMMSSNTPDYSLLANPLFNYANIKGAMAKGLSDNQVASILRISKLTGLSFRDVTDQVLEGKTFAAIAYDHNLKLSDVLEPDMEKQQIAAYLAAYESTGSMALKNPMMSSDMSMPMSSSASASTGSMGSMSSGSGMMATKNIVETAMSQKRFSTLVKLLKQANLVDTLNGPGPFTVFAPTNAAFKKLPKGTIKNLTPDQLSKILTYHVIPARVDAATAMAMTSPTSPPTVEGSTLQVTTQNGTVMVNDAKVVQADIQATNGIIHAIDTVLMPPDLSTGMSTPPAMGTDTTGTGATTMPATPPPPGQ